MILGSCVLVKVFSVMFWFFVIFIGILVIFGFFCVIDEEVICSWVLYEFLLVLFIVIYLYRLIFDCLYFLIIREKSFGWLLFMLLIIIIWFLFLSCILFLNYFMIGFGFFIIWILK